jgi:CRP/FNR family transcriptional regulator
VSITHEVLAAEIGSAREAVSRQVSQMARDGLLAQGRGVIEILDRPALERLARSTG